MSDAFSDAPSRVDRWQRRRPAVAFPVAVFKRYSEDRGGWLAATITYYGFFALAPMLAVAMTIAGMVTDRPARERILEALQDLLPFLVDDIQGELAPISGKPIVVAFGVLVAIWGGVNAMRVLQETMNQMWGIPRFRRPTFVHAVARGALVLGLMALGVVGTAIVTALTLGSRLPLAAAVATGVANAVINTALALGLFRLLVARDLRLRDFLPGACLVGVATYALTYAGGVYVQRIIANASSLYGSFATMVGFFAWVALLVQTVVYGTLVNVVRVEHLWPRSLGRVVRTPADRRAAAVSASRVVLLDDAPGT